MSAGRLVHAARSGAMAEVRALLDAGEDPNGSVLNGVTALREAAAGGRLGTLQLLLERGADPNIRDSDGATPLHAAALDLDGQGRAANRLLSFGADPDALDRDGKTPLHWMADFDCVRGAEDLVTAGADGGIRDSEGKTPAARARDEGLKAMLGRAAEASDLLAESMAAAKKGADKPERTRKI